MDTQQRLKQIDINLKKEPVNWYKMAGWITAMAIVTTAIIW